MKIMVRKTKQCSKCKEVKDLSFFCKNNRSPDGHYSMCNGCRHKRYEQNAEKHNKKAKLRYQKNREKRIEQAAECRKKRLELQPDYRAVERRRALAKEIGISPDIIEEHYKKYFMKQQAHCAICGKITEKLCIDHDHNKTGKESLRGLLCKKCNVGICWFDDNADFCKNASSYLEKFN